ncbi:MAG TPA: DUF1189 family protein [Bacillota bacterium]
MIFWKSFLNSMKLPNKQAMFQLNRTGMDITVVYMFILILIVSIPSLADMMTTTSGPTANMNLLFLLIYFFMFYYLPLTIFIFIALSIIAYIGTVIARFMKRKLHFSILWKMSAYTTTIPFLIYTFVAFVFPVSDKFLFLFAIFTFMMLIKIISVYPKRKQRPRQS